MQGETAQEREAFLKTQPGYQSTDYGPGSEFWTKGSAAAGLLAGALGGNLKAGAAAGAAPLLAELVSKQDDPTLRAVLHGIVAAALTQASGGSGSDGMKAGAIGAITASAMTDHLVSALYGKDVSELTADEKRLVSSLVTIAGGVAGTAGTDGDLSMAAIASSTAKVEVENNSLSPGAGDIGFWLGKTPDCDAACKANIAKGVAEGNLIVAGGVTIVAATAEIAVLARTALAGCHSAPLVCLNEAGIITAESAVPGGGGAGGAIGVGKTAAEAAAAKAEAVAVNALKNAGKETTQVKNLGNVSDFLSSQSIDINKKLGTKIGQGRLPYSASKEGVEQAKMTIKETLENVTQVSPVIPSSSVRGEYDLIHVYSSKTNSTVSLRVLPNGKYEFDTLIPEKSSKF
ncbi:TPA: VENN motif pre-toxin domain-containing protein [Citrobacter farmeri]